MIRELNTTQGRRYFGPRYGLLALLVFISILGLVPRATELQRASRQQQAAQTVRSLGGHVSTIPSQPVGIMSGWLHLLMGEPYFENVSWISWPNISTERDLDHLHAFPGLTSLAIGGPLVTGHSLNRLRGLNALESLSLRNTGRIDEGLDVLITMPQLRSLSLRNCPISDESLSAVAKVSRLETLCLHNIDITDEGLNRLHGASGLRKLELSKVDLSEAGILRLREAIPTVDIYWSPEFETPEVSTATSTSPYLPSVGAVSLVKNLAFHGPFTSDATLACLEAASALESLDVGETSISDAGVAHLAGLHNLQRFGASGTAITDAGLAHLRDLSNLALPVHLRYASD